MLILVQKVCDRFQIDFKCSIYFKLVLHVVIIFNFQFDLKLSNVIIALLFQIQKCNEPKL